MENILGTDEIQGKKFTDFLSSSIKAKERDTMVDYFDMVINRSFDAKMLEEINPISDFVYVNELNMEEKNLRTGFASVDRGLGVFMIQGTLEDITAQVKLQKELDAEAARRDEEMRSLFQVIKVDPRIFGDFIEDAEYEFNRINGILKNPEVSAAGAMGAIYQGVHAIKSNALILGLENFSVKLHELENKIKNIQDKSEISFDDALHITVELETIMREKDKYRDTIEKISAFKGGDSRRQDRYVLVETLTQACEKAAAAEEKKVKFIVEDLDGAVLENGPRRMMKEVLTQLIRNAVAHGIESPEEREAAGKTAEGQIRLSIKWADNQIHLKLSDDGRGLDFDRIRKKAESLNLFQSKDEVSDRNALLQVIFSPGFSTAGKATMIAGRGVGLDLVRDRVREHHGSIKLQTEKGKGTAFNLFIPMDASSAGKAAS
jgi:two-component system chemotaxis sensor kinase CheA